VWEGGISYEQFSALLDGAVKIDGREKEFLASIHGVQIDSDSKRSSKKTSSPNIRRHGVELGDTEGYKRLSEEQKEQWTNDIMEEYKTLFQGKGVKVQ